MELRQAGRRRDLRVASRFLLDEVRLSLSGSGQRVYGDAVDGVRLQSAQSDSRLTLVRSRFLLDLRLNPGALQFLVEHRVADQFAVDLSRSLPVDQQRLTAHRNGADHGHRTRNAFRRHHLDSFAWRSIVLIVVGQNLNVVSRVRS